LGDDPKHTKIKKEGKALVQRLKDWDSEMVQRKAKAYDDVENFENKFTAEYIFLINQTESSIPRVNKSSRDRNKELMEQWAGLLSTADVISSEVSAFNRMLWEAGVGAIWLGIKKGS